jgi:hypothetical protein
VFANLTIWGWAIGLGINVVIVWSVWSARRAFVPKEKFDKLAIRFTALEARVGEAPTKDSVHALALKLEELRGDVKKLSAGFDGMKEVFERIETPLNLLMEHHLHGGGDD